MVQPSPGSYSAGDPLNMMDELQPLYPLYRICKSVVSLAEPYPPLTNHFTLSKDRNIPLSLPPRQHELSHLQKWGFFLALQRRPMFPALFHPLRPFLDF